MTVSNWNIRISKLLLGIIGLVYKRRRCREHLLKRWHNNPPLSSADAQLHGLEPSQSPPSQIPAPLLSLYLAANREDGYPKNKETEGKDVQSVCRALLATLGT